jgi:hypothetical protein
MGLRVLHVKSEPRRYELHTNPASRSASLTCSVVVQHAARRSCTTGVPQRLRKLASQLRHKTPTPAQL